MAEQGKTLNPIYIVPDLLEQIFLRLPLKPILKFKTVSKQWKSILESKNFVEMRSKFQKCPKILVAEGDNQTESQFEEVEVVFFHCEDATRPSMTCDGLVCIPVPGSVNVLNPSTGELLSYPSGPNPVTIHDYGRCLFPDYWLNVFPGYYAMGFGKDKVNGSYKVVRMFFNSSFHCEILDLNIGEWKIVNPPPYIVEARRKSACVNGSIYWLEVDYSVGVLALDLHTEEFRSLPAHPLCSGGDQVVNLEDRLAIAAIDVIFEYTLNIWCIDEQEKTWSKIYSIRLLDLLSPGQFQVWFRPVAVSKQGNLFFYDSRKRLYKYDPNTDEVCCLSRDICVISPFVENLIRFRQSSFASPKTLLGYRSGFRCLEQTPSSRVPKITRRIELHIPNILLTTALVSLVIFRCFVVSSKT